jgi:hypothetical protein
MQLVQLVQLLELVLVLLQYISFDIQNEHELYMQLVHLLVMIHKMQQLDDHNHNCFVLLVLVLVQQDVHNSFDKLTKCMIYMMLQRMLVHYRIV